MPAFLNIVFINSAKFVVSLNGKGNVCTDAVWENDKARKEDRV
jgi:hypothetical protein